MEEASGSVQGLRSALGHSYLVHEEGKEGVREGLKLIPARFG